MNFNQFVATRQELPDLTTHENVGCNFEDIGVDGPFPGLVYVDSVYIEKRKDTYYTIAGRSEVEHSDLAVVEQWLWDEFAQYEFGAEDSNRI